MGDFNAKEGFGSAFMAWVNPIPTLDGLKANPALVDELREQSNRALNQALCDMRNSVAVS